MDTSLISRLKLLGFKHDEFPDGWYWHLTPDSQEKKIWLSKALGFEDELWDGPPDVVIFQVDEAGNDWQYAFDNDFGSLEEHVAMCVLDSLEETCVQN